MSTNLQQISRQVITLPATEQRQLRALLDELLGQMPPGNADNLRQKAVNALRDAGLYAPPGTALTIWEQTSNATLAEVQEAFRQAGGQPLSELALELRGPKE